MDAKVDKTPQMPAQTTMHGLTINADLSQGPYFIDGCDTLPKLFKQRCEELGERVAHREKISASGCRFRGMIFINTQS